MNQKKILVFLIIVCFLLPILNLYSLSSSYNIQGSLPGKNISFSYVLNSEDIQSPYYQDYFNKYNWEFDPKYAPLQILTIIHYDKNSNLDDFSFLAAIPIAIFNDSGIRKLSPIIYDNIIDNPNAIEFLTQWKKYNDYFGGLKRVIYIGDVSTQVRNKINDIFGPTSIYRPPLNFSSSNIYDLSAQLASYFWFTSDKIVIAQANNTISDIENNVTLPSITDIVYKKGSSNIIDIINSTNFDKFYNSDNVTINGGAILVEVNNTVQPLKMELIGNFSNPSNQWVFDTNNFTNNNWVFFPNVTFPADISDWGIHVFNISQTITDVPYNLTFYNFTSNFHTFQINYSNCQINFTLNSSDTKIWLLDPKGQFFSSSNQLGKITINYPSLGDWTLIVSGNTTHDIPYEISINIANYTTGKEEIIESATNGAVIASLLHIPLLYTNGLSLTEAAKQELSKLKPNQAIIVDPGNKINDSLFTELGISVISLKNMSIIMQYTYNISNEKDIIITSVKEGFFAPSGLIAAFHGGTVLPVYNATYNFYGKAIENYQLMEYSYFQSPLRNGPIYSEMVNLSAIYHNWINSFDPTVINRTVVIVSPLNDLNPIFDRAITGKSIVGRFPGENETETTLFICRNIFYRALIFKNITSDSAIIYRQSSSQILNCKGIVSANLKGEEIPQSPDLLPPYNFNNTFEYDNRYHFLRNNSGIEFGEIQVPYYIELKDHQIIFENISQIDILLVANISYQNSSVQFAGWKIWNWTSQNLTTISENVFNVSTKVSSECRITLDNLTHFVNTTLNNRIEIYFYVNATAPTINGSVDYLAFNVSLWAPFARQNVLMSSISYWHNFTIFSQTYNYSDDIPNLFQNYDYVVRKGTGYNEINNTLIEQMALWYQCSLGNFSSTPFEDLGYLAFLLNNYSRGYNTGGDVQNPLGTQGNPVDPGNKLWKSSLDISNSLFNKSMNLSFIVLNDDFLASTQIPLTYLRKGATTVIANLRKNTLGYSEHLQYTFLKQMLMQNYTGISLIAGLATVSHLYSFNWQCNITENPPFDENTEDSHQFIILGDPELVLVNSSSRLILPGNYKPLILNVMNETIRTGDWNFNPDQKYPDLFDPIVYINATDIDSDEYNPNFNVLGNFYINPSPYLATYSFSYLTSPIESYNYKCSNIPIFGNRIFSYNDSFAPLDLNGMKIQWFIFDGTENTTAYSYLTLISNAPLYWQYYRKDYSLTEYVLSHFYLNNGTTNTFLPYNVQNKVGRVNETLIADIVVGDTDFDRFTAETAQTQVVLCMNITDTEGNHWINITLGLNQSISAFDDPSLNPSQEPYKIYGRCSWNGSYTFKSDDPFGYYDFWIYSIDTLHGNQSRFEKVAFNPTVEIIDWAAQINNFSNNSNEIFRVNETLSIDAKFFDVDDYLDENFNRITINDSIPLHCEENASLSVTNISLKGSDFLNDYHQTFYNDSTCQSAVNDSNGEILIPYAINLTNAAINFINITEIEIKLEAKINSTENISFAGWKIYNWTSQSMVTINDLIFNTTSEKLDLYIIKFQNFSYFINQTYNNRVEIYFYVNTSNNINASIDYISFNVTYPVNKTGISAELQLKSLNQGGWINRTMDYDKIREIWSLNWTFTPENKSGLWQVYFNLTDKDRKWYVYNTGYNITVKNHLPIIVNWSKSADIVYRNQLITFFANVTDMDVYNRSSDLDLTAALWRTASNTWKNLTHMPFNVSLNAWQLNWVPPVNLTELGNYTYTIKADDSEFASAYVNTNLNFTILNNLPIINVTKFIPSDFKFFEGEIIEVSGNFSDVEFLNKSFIQLNDSTGHMIQKIIFFPPFSKSNETFYVQFSKNDYQYLDYSGTWDLHILLLDSDGVSTMTSYRLSLEMPPILPPAPPFAWEYLIMAGLIITVVLGTIIVYRFVRREEIKVPASRVKAIIKKMVEEREQAEIQEEEIIKEREIKEKIKKKPITEIKQPKPVPKEKIEHKKEKLDKLELKNLEIRLSETLNSAREAIRKNNISYAADLYQKAAKLSSKLGNFDKAKRFSERAEELYKKGKK